MSFDANIKIGGTGGLRPPRPEVKVAIDGPGAQVDVRIGGPGIAADSGETGALDPGKLVAGLDDFFFDPVEPPAPSAPARPADLEERTEGRRFSSKGDPHEKTGDGLRFDNNRRGTFTKLRSASGDFELQTTQGRLGGGVYNLQAAVRLGADVVTFDPRGRFTLNGATRPLAVGETLALAGGGSATRTERGLTLRSPQGDVVELDAIRGKYLNVAGEIAASRPAGDVRGSLGNFDADSDRRNDLVGPDGTVYPRARKGAFIEAWRTPEGQDLALAAGVPPPPEGRLPRPRPLREAREVARRVPRRRLKQGRRLRSELRFDRVRLLVKLRGVPPGTEVDVKVKLPG